MPQFRTLPDDSEIRFVEDASGSSGIADPSINILEIARSREEEAVKIGQLNQLRELQAKQEYDQFTAPIKSRNKLEDPADPGNRYNFQAYLNDIKAGYAQPPAVNPVTKKYDLPPQYSEPGHPEFYRTMDPGAWTMEQAKDFIKKNPARTPEEEAQNNEFLKEKEMQLAKLQASMSSYDAYTFEQQQADLNAGKTYEHVDLLKDPVKMSAFQAFAVPYTKGVQGFFTRPFGKEPLEDLTPERMAKTEKDHPVATAVGKAFGGTVPYAAAMAPQSLLAQIFAFGAVGATGQAGKEKMEGSLMDKKGSEARIVKATVKSAAYAPLFFYTKALQLGGPVTSVLTRAGARGAGAAGIEKSSGATTQEAAMAGLATAALSGLFELTPIAVSKINTTIRNKSFDQMAETVIKHDTEFVNGMKARFEQKYGKPPSEQELKELVRAGLVIDSVNSNATTIQITAAAERLKKRFEPKRPDVLKPGDAGYIPRGERGSVLIPDPPKPGDIVRAGEQIGKVAEIIGDKASIINALGRKIEVPTAEIQHTGLLPQELPAKQLEKVPQAKREYVQQIFKMENPEVVDELIHNDPQYQADIALNDQMGDKAFARAAEAVHIPYVRQYLQKANDPNVAPAKGKPELIIWMGLPGSGKSQLSKQMGLRDTHVQVDPDDAKLYIPESKENPALANYVQNESAYMADNLLFKEVLSQKKSIIWPKIGKNADTLLKIIDEARKSGYGVKLYYNKISTVESKKRAYKRYLEEKRLVSADYIDSVGDLTLDRVYDKVKSEADEFAAWDVNTRFGEAPKQIDKGVGYGQEQGKEAAAGPAGGPEPAAQLEGSGGSPGRGGADGVSGDGETVGPDGQKVRRFINTVKDAPNTRADVAGKVEGKYTPIGNPQTVAEAKALLAENPTEANYLIWKEGPITRHEAAMGALELERLQQEGNVAEAVRLAEHLAKRGTESGQGVQALYIYERLSPEGIIMTAQRAVRQARESGGIPKTKLDHFNKLSKTLKGKDLDDMAQKLGIPHISEVVAGELRSMAEAIQKMPAGRDKEIATALMLKKMGDQIPRTIWDKVSMVQTIAQLLNPKTFVRNLLGNAVFQGTEGISDALGSALDIAVSLRTGKRTVYPPNLAVQAQGAAQGFKEGVQESLLGVNLKTGESSKFTLPKNGVFDKGVMGALEKTLRISLGATDRAFYQAAFNQSLRDQMVSSKLEEPSEEMIEKAHLIGLYRTFQDDNAISRQFVALKKWLNAGGKWGLGDIVLKYPKTPANILARGLEYSPLGFAKVVYKLAQPLAGHGFDQEDFVRSTSRAFTGSVLLVGAGALLATLGIISGKRSKDRDVQAARENVGIRDYQINTSALKRFAMSGMDPEQAKLQEGDELVTYDWMQPSSISIALGANMVLDPKSNLVDRTLNLGDRLLQASETLQEQPLVSGVKTLTGRGNISEGLSDVVAGMPASFVPTLLNQVRQLTDNTARNTKDPNYFKEVYNKALVRIPGASFTLPPRIDTLGRDKQMYQNGSNNPFNVFLNPAFVSKYRPDPASKMVLDIWESSGQTVQLPRVASAKIKLGSQSSEPLELTAAQYTEFQKYIGNKTDILFTALSGRETFMQQDDETKAKKLQGYLTDIYTAGKIEVLGYRPAHVNRDVKSIIRDIGRNKQRIDANEIRTQEEEPAAIRAVDDQ